MKKELSNFINITTRTYFNWKRNHHKNIILIINKIFYDKEDINLWKKYKILPYFKYFNNLEEDNTKEYRILLCKILGIKESSYYSWKKGRYSNIILLFNQIFRNKENIGYWLKNKEFELLNNKNKSSHYIDILNELNNLNFCNDNFNEKNSTFLFKSINLNSFQNLSLISLNPEILNLTEENIQLKLINSINITQLTQTNHYIKYINSIKKYSSKELKYFFSLSNIYQMFLYSIKNTDINLFTKVVFLVYKNNKNKIKTFLNYLDEILNYKKTNNQFEILNKNINISTREIRTDILIFLFTYVVSFLDTINIDDYLPKKIQFLKKTQSLILYQKLFN